MGPVAIEREQEIQDVAYGLYLERKRKAMASLLPGSYNPDSIGDWDRLGDWFRAAAIVAGRK